MVEMARHMRTALADVPTLKIFDFSQYVAQIPGIINFTIGEPDFNTPEYIKEAGIKSLQNNHTHYAPQRGTTGLLNAIADTLASKYGLQYDPKTEILVTNGVTEGIFAALMAIINPGDVVLIPTPTYSIYGPDVTIAGGVPVEIDTSATDFKLTPKVLRRYLEQYGDHVKALIIVNPSNPTGVVYRQDELDALAEVIREQPIFAISDEIYSELNYDGDYSSIARVLPEQTILTNGFSKSYAMTGWRIGYLCAPKEVCDQIFKVHAFALTDIATFTQDAAEAALKAGDEATEKMNQQYIKRRDYMYQRLTAMGFNCTQPMGAFYIFAKIPDFLDQDDTKLVYELAQQAKVAVTAGAYFGQGGQGYLRFSYATDLDLIKTGMDRLEQYCAQQKEK